MWLLNFQENRQSKCWAEISRPFFWQNDWKYWTNIAWSIFEQYGCHFPLQIFWKGVNLISKIYSANISSPCFKKSSGIRWPNFPEHIFWKCEWNIVAGPLTAHSPTHSPAHSPAHSPTHSTAHSPAHSTAHSFWEARSPVLSIGEGHSLTQSIETDQVRKTEIFTKLLW